VSELAKRVLVSLVAVPVAVGAAYLGGAALSALLGIIAAVACWELFRIARAGGIDPLPVGVGLAAALPLVVQAHYQRVFTITLSVGAVLTVALLGLAIWTRGVERRPLSAVAVTVFGILYTGGMLSFAFGLRYHRFTIGAVAGAVLLAFPLVLTWASDIGGYFVGRAVGRRKLAPAVSPGKTVEGALGGLLLTILVAWAYSEWVLTPHGRLALTVTGAMVVGATISIAAQMGDLAESMLKREAGVKDSSGIVPGHGGVLDRIDSLLFVLPVAYLLLDRGGLLQPVIR
jgi:phosphatidate cytidylyltransferase